MGRITGVLHGASISVERPAVSVEIYDPWFGKIVTTEYPLAPVSFTRSPGPWGGGGELLHSVSAFSSIQSDDFDLLRGCYVKIKVKNKVLWAGVITGQRINHRIDTDSGDDFVTFRLNDLWNAVADQSLYQSLYGTSASGMLYWIQKLSPYARQVAGESGITQTYSLPTHPLLPYNASGSLILDIDVDSFNLSNATSFPRFFGNAPIGEIICALGEELHHEMVVIKPSSSRTKLGTITAVSLSESPKVIAFGGGNDDEYDAPVYFPLATSITGNIDYNGTITDIRMVGGDITETISVKLTPAWDDDLTEDVIVNPNLIGLQPHKYGLVGRIFYANVGGDYQLLPYSDVCKTRSSIDSLENAPSNNTDSCRIWEYRGNLTDEAEAMDTDGNWSETESNHVFLQYDPSISATKQIRKFFYGADFNWEEKNMALVVFSEPQLLIGLKKDDEDGLISDPDNEGVKLLVLEAIRRTGTMAYFTGNEGKYPRPRYRYFLNPAWVKHLTTHFTDTTTTACFHSRYALGETGRIAEKSGLSIDYTIPMYNETRRVIDRMSRALNNVLITISGIDQTWDEGDWIGTVVALNGSIIRSELDWYVREIRYDIEKVETYLNMGGKRHA